MVSMTTKTSTTQKCFKKALSLLNLDEINIRQMLPILGLKLAPPTFNLNNFFISMPHLISNCQFFQTTSI